jgi:hypothetical protein
MRPFKIQLFIKSLLTGRDLVYMPYGHHNSSMLPFRMALDGLHVGFLSHQSLQQGSAFFLWFK